MSEPYPCVLDIDRPEQFERSHVFLRLLAFLALAVMGVPLSAVLVSLYLLLPVIAGAEIAARHGRYLTELAPRLLTALQVVLDSLAYAMLLTDRIPRIRSETVRFSVSLRGDPTVASALLRLIYALPELAAIAILGILSMLLWMVSAIFVLAVRTYPESIFAFQRGMLRWIARLLVYLASLVDRYPPFALDTGNEARVSP